MVPEGGVIGTVGLLGYFESATKNVEEKWRDGDRLVMRSGIQLHQLASDIVV